MSQKAAVVLILDVGYSENLHPEEGEKFLQTSRECASMIIQSKIFTNSKDEVGLILMGCQGNDDGDSLRNIHVASHVCPPTWHMVRKLTSSGTKNYEADWIEAINVALDLLRSKSGKFSERKIAIFTSNLKLRSLKKLITMECGIHDQVVDLLLIHPKISDDPAMAKLNDEINEAITVVEKVEGTEFDIDEAAVQLLSFQKKKVKPRPWNICLDIGSKILIPVSGYKKMNESQNLKWDSCLSSDAKSIIFPEKFAPSTSEQSLGESLPDSSTKVSRVNINTRNDGTEVDKFEIIEGFHFGSSIVPFTEEDKEQLKYFSGEKCLSVLKITKKKFIPRHHWIEKSTTCFVARDDDEDAALAFSALVNALQHMESVAIVRRLYYSGTKPHMGALIPVIKPSREFLVFVELPFSNYMRKCLLPQLKFDHLTSDQFDVIDRLIDGMDLSAPGDEDNVMGRQWSDLLKPHKVFDPYLQHVRRCIASRILNPEAPLPNVDPKLYNLLAEPPQPIKEAVSDTIDEITRLFPNLEQESDFSKKGRGKRKTASRGADVENPDANIDDQPSKHQRKESQESEMENKNKEPEIVGILSPIDDFKAAVELKAIPFIEVCKHMQEVIVKLVLNSFGLADFEKPKDCLRTLRCSVLSNEVEKSDSVTSFNNWMKGLYQLLQEKCKTGFWTLVMQESLGFITCEECSESSLTVGEVKEMLEGGASLSIEFSDDEEMDLPLDL